MEKKQIVDELAADIFSMLRSDTMSRAMASMLYGKGWRKQSEGEWRFSGYSLMGDRAYECSECGFAVANIDDVYIKFCPNCAAQMKGGQNEQ